VDWSGGPDDAELYMRTEYRDFYLKHSYSTDKNEIIIDSVKYKKVNNGLNIVIYNPQTNVIADVFGVDMYKDFEIIR
jgi:hypothetical protein